VKIIVVETAGFAETGADGKAAQERIREIIKAHGCRLLGPNCSGVINTHVGNVNPSDWWKRWKRGTSG
jgi:acyl-CoA synthetase (NDP forming)